ncbi:NAD(P)H-binding protein [Mycobacterium sp. E735]|uniref:NAD(P)H-binding protein n=1 Tax=Mycobacterium sp. E735 TaxID=1834148 RepID=UPI0007FE5BA9|nr:NAD(P)H-binding protein [Mycobacterium sp. E735]OBG68207.1 NAD-dependent epimerase [Mycobacterium sp. E735]
MRCLVTGATGYIGARLAPRLLDEGHEVRALARNPAKLEDVPWRQQAEVARGDLGDVDSLIAAFDGIDVVYYLVHSMGTSKDFADEEARAVGNVVTAARRAGVRRVVYLSGLHPEGGKLSPHLESRAAVGEALIASGIETVVLQAGVVVGSGSASFEMIRHLTDRLPVMTTPKWVHNKIQPIAVRDVLYYLVAAADPGLLPAGAYDIAGPDTTSYRELLKTYARISGRWHAGLSVGRVDTGLASLVTGVALPVPPGLAGDLVESLDHPMTASETDLRDRVPDPPGGLLGVEDAIALALADQPHRPSPVNALADPHHLANTDPVWAGGDARRIRHVARRLTPPVARPALGLVNMVPGPLAGALRTGLDLLIALTPKVRPA